MGFPKQSLHKTLAELHLIWFVSELTIFEYLNIWWNKTFTMSKMDPIDFSKCLRESLRLTTLFPQSVNPF